jgi:hypothetical protein
MLTRLDKVENDADNIISSIRTTAPGVYTPASIAKTAGLHERCRVSSNLMTLGSLCVNLVLRGVSAPMKTFGETLADRKANGRVEALPAVVARVNVLKEKGNT